MADENESLTPLAVGPDGWRFLLWGFLFALPCVLIDQLHFLLSYLSILVHEFGHSFTAWLFGYYSIPSFNLEYGGGFAFTWLDDRHYWLLLPVLLFCGWLFWRNRGNVLVLSLLLPVLAAYSFLYVTKWHVPLIIFMGHGNELVFSGIFFYRAMSGTSLVDPHERPVYAFAAFFLELHALLFAWKLLCDPIERIVYVDGLTVGGHVNDFVEIARDYLHVDLSVVSAAFLLACLLPPLAAFLFHRYRPWLIVG